MADIRITPGSSIMAFTSSLSYKQTITQDPSGSVVLYGSGSTNRTNVFAVNGANGRLLSVNDDLSNSLFSANTISGLPVIEAFADSTVKIGKYGQEAIVVSGSGGDLQLSGSIKLPSLVTAADTNVVVFNTTSKKISYNTALSLQGTQGTTGNTVQGSPGTAIQGSPGTAIQGSPGTTIQGSSGATIQGAAGTSVQGSSGVSVQGSSGATIQGAAGASVQGSTGTTIQGTAGTGGSPGAQGSTGAGASIAGPVNGVVYSDGGGGSNTSTNINVDNNNLYIKDTAAVPGGTPGQVALYSQNLGAGSELTVIDGTGNKTVLSPHNFSLIPEGPSEPLAWSYYSEQGDKTINVDMLKMARLLEQITGEKLVYIK
jgi:hypothetical protein